MYHFTVNGWIYWSFTKKEARVAVELAREWVRDYPNGKLRFYDGKGGIETVDLKKLPRKPATPRKTVTKTIKPTWDLVTA